MADESVPGGVGQCGVLRGHHAGSDGGGQSAHPDAARRAAHAAQVRTDDLAHRGAPRLLQGKLPLNITVVSPTFGTEDALDASQFQGR